MILLAGGGLYGLLDLYREINERVAARRFAMANDMDFYRDGYRPEYPGIPFQADCYLPYFMNTRQALPLEFGYLRPHHSQRRSSSAVTYTYVRLKLPVSLPHMVVQLRKSSILPSSFTSSAQLRLEGQFGDMFNLYVPKGLERDGLYIFTPDVMARFIDAVGTFDCEIIGDELYLYSQRKILFIQPENLRKLVVALNYLLPKFDRQSTKYAQANERLRITGGGPQFTRMSLKPGVDYYVTIAAFALLASIGLVLFFTRS